MTLDQKQKQFWNRHAKRNKNPRDPNVSVLLGAFVSRSNIYVYMRLSKISAPFEGHDMTYLKMQHFRLYG